MHESKGYNNNNYNNNMIQSTSLSKQTPKGKDYHCY